MTNPLTEQMQEGLYGELFAQLRLLEYYVQCAIPQKDTGNAKTHGSNSISEFARDTAVNFTDYLLQIYTQGVNDVKTGRIKR